MNTSKSATKKFCGVCHKAGSSDYESHFTKSVPGPNGIVICPTILNSMCKCCGKYGHFSDHCPTASKSKNKEYVASVAPISHATPIVKSKISNINRFSVLNDCDSDDDKPLVKRVKFLDEKQEIINRAPNGISFATMLLKPAPVVIKPASFNPPAFSVNSNKMIVNKRSGSWLSDSEDDSDYHDDYDDYDDNSAW